MLYVRTEFTSEAAEELAATLVRLAPAGLTHVLFVNSGSEATELAMRTAVQYWRERGQPQRTCILGRTTSYHGMTLGALSMSGHALRRRDYGGLLHVFDVLPDLRAWDDLPSAKYDEAEERARCFAAIAAHGAERVAAIIVEPVVGAAAGVFVPPPLYLRTLRQICDELGILLIADEIITAFGRTGAWFASEQFNVVPDLVALGKGMTSGYTPMAALLIRENVAAAMRAGSGIAPFAHTFSANPLSAATSLAVVRYMEANSVIENGRRLSTRLEGGIAKNRG